MSTATFTTSAPTVLKVGGVSTTSQVREESRLGRTIASGSSAKRVTPPNAIIERKGATYYAVAVALLRIVEAVIRDQRTVPSVSSVVGSQTYDLGDACLSLPSIIGAGGVDEVLPLRLDAAEEGALRATAEIVRRAQAELATN